MRGTRASLIATIVGLALVATACGGEDDGVTVPLAEQNDSGITGEATLTDVDGRTEVVVELDEAGPGPQPIHIHPGTCENLDPEPAFPLTDVMGGTSETTVDVSVDELTSGDFAINAHQSPEEIEVYVACGAIEG